MVGDWYFNAKYCFQIDVPYIDQNVEKRKKKKITQKTVEMIVLMIVAMIVITRLTLYFISR